VRWLFIVLVCVVIVDAILALGALLIGALSSALPALSTAWDSRPDFSTWGTFVGEKVGPIDTLVPIAQVFGLLDVTFSYVVPAVIAYSVAHWIYSHLPVVGKG